MQGAKHHGSFRKLSWGLLLHFPIRPFFHSPTFHFSIHPTICKNKSVLPPEKFTGSNSSNQVRVNHLNQSPTFTGSSTIGRQVWFKPSGVWLKPWPKNKSTYTTTHISLLISEHTYPRKNYNSKLIHHSSTRSTWSVFCFVVYLPRNMIYTLLKSRNFHTCHSFDKRGSDVSSVSMDHIATCEGSFVLV